MKVGILGNGQLSKMLQTAARGLALEPIELVPGQTQTDAQVITFENEWVSPAELAQFKKPQPVSSAANPANPNQRPEPEVWPSPDSLAVLQNKKFQKELFDKLKIDTAPWELLAPGQLRPRSLAGDTVYKWSLYGYDGKGVLCISPQTPDSTVSDFVTRGQNARAEVYAEKKIPYVAELALVGVFPRVGSPEFYPLVESRQKNGVCLEVEGPYHPKRYTELQKQAELALTRIGESLNYVGVLAMELFQTADGKIWVNECAPRVHNSGHCTRVSAMTSQFENHWRAILGMELGSTDLKAPHFMMRNLLGPEGLNGKTPDGWAPKILNNAPKTWDVLWYGKNDIRPRRKLGHITAIAQTAEQLEQAKNQIIEIESQLWNEVKGSFL